MTSLTPRCAKIESASSAIFRATVQPCSRSVAPAAAASVLESGISTAIRTHASTRFVRERRHPPHAAPKSSPARPPSELAPSRPRPRRARRAPRANGWEPRLGDRVAPGVPIWRRGAPRPPEQGRCALHRARGGGAHRAGPWAAARAGAGRLQVCATKRRRARSAICGSRCEPRRRPGLQPRAGTCIWHRARQSRWSPARAARRRAPRCATPPRPFRQTAKSQIFGFIDERWSVGEKNSDSLD